MPEHLYKYRALTAHSLGALINNTLWFAKPSSFNDPYDCAISVDESRRAESILAVMGIADSAADDQNNEELAKQVAKSAPAFDQFRANILMHSQGIGICSFSELSDHMLMWAHYANNHKGLVVEYACTPDLELQHGLAAVDYQLEVPSLLATDFSPEKSRVAGDRLWQTKAKCWEYEKEWRIMIPKGDKVHRSPLAIKSVIFGAKMPHADRALIWNAVQHRGYRFKEAKLRDGTFIIEVKDIEVGGGRDAQGSSGNDD